MEPVKVSKSRTAAVKTWLVVCALTVSVFIPASIPAEDHPSAIESKVDISYLVNGRRPIWMGPVIRYTVYETTRVEARFISLTGELVQILELGEQAPGQYTLPWDGSTDEGALFEGKYQFELYFGDDYACKFWFISKSLMDFEEPT
jgi:hypothetical protein